MGGWRLLVQDIPSDSHEAATTVNRNEPDLFDTLRFVVELDELPRGDVVMSNRPIGVFDSGIGGLSVLAELTRRLPHESFLYFADLARVPYGDRSTQSIRSYSKKIARFLARGQVKAMVVACNTMCAAAAIDIRAESDAPVFDVVEIGADSVLPWGSARRFGVLATAATVKHATYQRAILARQPQATVISVACPRLVPLVEQGLHESSQARLVLRDYMQQLSGESIDTLILGCTHYSFLQTEVRNIVGPGIRVVNPSLLMADVVVQAIEKGKVQASAQAMSSTRVRYFVTGHSDRFTRLASSLLPEMRASSVHSVDLDSSTPGDWQSGSIQNDVDIQQA